MMLPIISVFVHKSISITLGLSTVASYVVGIAPIMMSSYVVGIAPIMMSSYVVGDAPIMMSSYVVVMSLS